MRGSTEKEVWWVYTTGNERGTWKNWHGYELKKKIIIIVDCKEVTNNTRSVKGFIKCTYRVN